MGTRPPVAHDRAAAPAQGFEFAQRRQHRQRGQQHGRLGAGARTNVAPAALVLLPAPPVEALVCHLALWFRTACRSSCCGCSSRTLVSKCDTAVLTHTAPVQLRLLEQSCASTPLPSQPPAAGDGWCRWPSRHGGVCMAASRLHAPRRSSASALRRTTCCTSARAWGAAPPARCSGAPSAPAPAGALGGEAAGSLPAATVVDQCACHAAGPGRAGKHSRTAVLESACRAQQAACGS